MVYFGPGETYVMEADGEGTVPALNVLLMLTSDLEQDELAPKPLAPTPEDTTSPSDAIPNVKEEKIVFVGSRQFHMHDSPEQPEENPVDKPTPAILSLTTPENTPPNLPKTASPIDTESPRCVVIKK